MFCIIPASRVLGVCLMMCDLWGQNQANITRASKNVCNATASASVQKSLFSDLLWAAVPVQRLIA